MNKHGYTITEEDIDAYLRLRQHETGDTLTREQARQQLSELQTGLHLLAHDDPAKLYRLQKKVSKKKQD